MRGVFRENFKESELGVRTKKIIELVTQKIFELDPSKAEEEAKSGIYNLHAYRQAEYLCQPHPSRRSNGYNTQDQPINMAGAFEVPINASAYGGYIEASIKALSQYAQRVYGSFAQEPDKTYVIGAGLEELGSKVNVNTLLSILAEDMHSIFNESQ